MRVIPTNLRNDIMAGTIANCIKITLKAGTVYGYTDCDTTLIVDGVSYVPSPGLQKVKMTLTNNAEVSNQEFGSAWVDAPESDLKGGKFDSAEVEVAWVSWKNPSYGRLVVFTGQLGEITWTEDGFKADIVSSMKNLTKNIGTVFSANCRHALFSTAEVGKVGYCGIDKSAYTFSGSVGAVSVAKWKFTISGVSKPDGYFDNGYVKFTSGLNNNLSAIIKNQTGNLIELFLPTAFVIAPGDTFQIFAGCDLTLATCRDKFNNVNNFGGFPHIQPDVNYR